MNQIDFLPEAYGSQHKCQRRLARQIILLVVVGACMASWYVHQRTSLKANMAYVAALEHEKTAVKLQKQEAAQRRERINVLRYQQSIQRELAQPITQATIIGTISRLLPESVAVTNLSLTQKRPRVKTAAQLEKEKKAAAKSKGKGADASKAKVQPPVFLLVEVEGLAPSGVELANLIGALEDNPLFADIKMNDSRSKQIANLIALEFALEARVSFDRDYKRPRVSAGQDKTAGTLVEATHAN